MQAPSLELVDIDSIVPHPDNANEGDVGAVADLIVHNGWFAGCQVQIRDGEPDRLFVGETRWRALAALQAHGGVVREDGAETPMDYAALVARAEALDLPALPPPGKVWVQRYAVSDRVALRHMLADNRAHDLARYNDDRLALLLSDIAAEDGLVGTGFDDDALDALLRDVTETEAPADVPEPSAKESARPVVCPECGCEFLPAKRDTAALIG